MNARPVLDPNVGTVSANDQVVIPVFPMRELRGFARGSPARVSVENRLSMADSIVLATARA